MTQPDPPATSASAAAAALAEDEVLAAVRARAVQVLEVPSVPVCALLRLLARTADVSHAVEIGGAGGLTAAWTLDGMSAKGVLTSIESDPHRHQLAVSGWSEAGVSDTVRGILGDPLTVMGRLRDDQYDLVVVQSPVDTAGLDEIHRLLHDGGLLVVLVAKDGPDVEAAVAEHQGFDDLVLPLDLGVVLATARPTEA